MASTSETGHAINVANFEDLISFCQGFGTAYNPSKASLKIAQLQALLASVKSSMLTVTNSAVAYNGAVSARMQAFEDLRKLTPRLVNALLITDAPPQLIKEAKATKAKILGYRLNKPAVSAKTTRTAPPQTDPLPPTPQTVSTSQVSYDSLVEHFAKLIAILGSEPSYTPNETELKLTSLNARLTALQQTNTDVINAYTVVSNARVLRNQALYDAATGLCAIALQVKTYTKATFGTSSAQYKQLSRIAFRGPKL
ncbi:MAG: hypothetical protein JST26_01665 [Bacteroidetes bacterium]|nr:hypothetical protein [Bacteroidota bacterium]